MSKIISGNDGLTFDKKIDDFNTDDRKRPGKGRIIQQHKGTYWQELAHRQLQPPRDNNPGDKKA